MNPANTNLSDIEDIISILQPEDISKLFSNLYQKQRHTVDYSFRQRRIAKTDLYFSAEPKPHQKIDGDIMSPEEYNEMREGVRQQCISGVDL